MKQKICRVPVYLQMEAVECGAVSLSMVLAYYKRYIPPEVLRVDCGVSRDGCSVRDILRAARAHGLKAAAVKTGIAGLRRRTDFPIILHWNYAHFVVLCGFRKNAAVINDPAYGRVTVPLEEFERAFTGFAILLSPSETFERVEQQKLTALWKNSMTPYMRAMLTALTILGLLMAILKLTGPLFYRYYSDHILLEGATARLGSLLLVMGLVALLTLLIQWLQTIFIAGLVRTQVRSGSRAYVRKLLVLPEKFYARRFVGNLVARLPEVDSVARFFFAALIPTVIDLAMGVLYLVILMLYHVELAVVGVACSLLDLLLVWLERRKNEGASAKLERDTTRLGGLAVSIIYMMESLKACGAEGGTFRQLTDGQATLSRSRREWRQKTENFNVLLRISAELSSGIILFLGILCIFHGHLTIGMLMAFQGLMDQMLSPAKQLAGSVKSVQLAMNDNRRIRDAMDYPIQSAFDEEDTAGALRLRGEISLEHVTFSYSRMLSPLLQDFSLRIPAGSMVVLTGGSGCGKSTLCQLITGQYLPDSGEILFDGVPAKQTARGSITRSMAVVSQRISLFSGTVRDNLTLWDNTVPEEDLVCACQAVGIYDTILRMGKGFDSVLLENGGNLSGGQRQQLELARALVKNPSILIMDEATSALDPVSEKQVMDQIRARGITCIVVAHRLSAIRDADQIVVLEHGAILEQGTHDELVKAGGSYASLL